MENYAELGGEMGREELYLTGYCNYVAGNYDRAIEQLSKVASGGDEWAQNASYHLGDCYLQTGDKQRAMSAFALAASADFDQAIREESMFNYGKLQYELDRGGFNAAITTLDNYIKTYPIHRGLTRLVRFCWLPILIPGITMRLMKRSGSSMIRTTT